MRIFLQCILVALLVPGCSLWEAAKDGAERAGTALGGAFVAPYMAAYTAPPDAPAFQPVAGVPPGQAVVYIYRGTPRQDTVGTPDIIVDGEKKFQLLMAGYGVLNLSPGEHEISAKGSYWANWTVPEVTHRLRVEPGQEYYLRVSIEFRGNVPEGVITLQSRSLALPEISRSRLVTAKD
jgi:Protein of unknown function (DUF2846)